MEPIIYIDRVTGEHRTERVYGSAALKLLYGDDLVSKVLGAPLLQLLSKVPLFSALYGFWQKLPLTKSKIVPFIQAYEIDPGEFLDPVDSFKSFNDFFIRKLKPEARPQFPGEGIATMPADGRYLFYQNIGKADGFVVKGQKFCLATLLDDEKLASEYAQGAMMMARLCPTDYHRFHFPCACIPGETRFINGWLYSVNPMAIKKDIHIFTQNKRAVCELHTDHFGKVLFIEIGATFVGSIHQTYVPAQKYAKGDEKGYFSFGASSLILLFQPGKIVFDEDLLNASAEHCEIKCLMGQSMGRKG